MGSLFSSLACCFWWFLAGTLLGWLLNRWLCKCNSSTTQQVTHTQTLAPTPAPAAAPVKLAEAPAAKTMPVATIVDLAAAKKAGFTIKNANDLTIVEGIGPKINELFHNAGIKTFAQLAAATVPQMRKILDDGGSRFRIANPGTWAQQGALAAENKWSELKTLQNKLSAGVKK